MNAARPPDHDLDRLLDADRGEFAGVYDRLSRAEPPRRLDRAILAEASRVALGAPAPRTHRWMLGLGSAAGLVLAAGIAWQVGQQRDAEVAVPAAAPRPAAVEVVPVQAITPRAPAAHDRAPQETTERASESAPVAIEKKREAVQRRAAAPKPAPPQAPPPAPAPVAAAAESATPASAPRPAEPLREEAEAFADDAVRSADPAPQESRERSAASDREGAAKVDAAASTRIGNATGARAGSAPPAPSTSVQLRNNMQRDPEDWLAEISRLEQAGRHQEAVENLRLFRRVHPDWPIGDRLRRLIE